MARMEAYIDANQHNMEATMRSSQKETIKAITEACRGAREL
jgi:hypothetical protein